MAVAINGRTWVAGELVGAADMNTIRDDLQELAAIDNMSILDREVSLKTITNTTDTALSHSVPGGTLGIDAGLLVEVMGDYLYNGGGAADLTVTVLYGATTLLTFTINLSTNANRRAVAVRAWVHAANATNAQRAHGECVVGAVSTVGGAGATPQATSFAVQDTCAEDSTGALTFTVTVATGSGAATFRRHAAYLRHITT